MFLNVVRLFLEVEVHVELTSSKPSRISAKNGIRTNKHLTMIKLHLFFYTKRHLAGQNFHDDVQIKTEIEMRFPQQGGKLL